MCRPPLSCAAPSRAAPAGTSVAASGPTRRFAIRRVLAVAWLAFSAVPANADMVVVMNARSPVAALSQDEVINIFMGRHRRLPDTSLATPLDAPAGSEERRLFYRRLLDRSPEEINVYWARLVFSGHTTPPRPMPSIPALLAEVASHPLMVGYAERRDITRDLKVVFSLPE